MQAGFLLSMLYKALTHGKILRLGLIEDIIKLIIIICVVI